MQFGLLRQEGRRLKWQWQDYNYEEVYLCTYELTYKSSRTECGFLARTGLGHDYQTSRQQKLCYGLIGLLRAQFLVFFHQKNGLCP